MTATPTARGEDRLYTPIKEILDAKFSSLGFCYFEDTHDTHKEFSDQLKDKLDYDSMFVLKAEKMHPDLTGYVTESGFPQDHIGLFTTHIIVVEIKSRLALKDIYQTKRYAEILKAYYALLISPHRLSVECRRFLIKREGQIVSFYPNNQVIIGLYDEKTKSIKFDSELSSNLKLDEKQYKVLFPDDIFGQWKFGEFFKRA